MNIKDFYAAANDIDFIVNANNFSRDISHIAKPFIRKNNDKISKLSFQYIYRHDYEFIIFNYINNFLEHYTYKEKLIKLLETQILKQIKNYIPFKINLAKNSYKYDYFASYLLLV